MNKNMFQNYFQSTSITKNYLKNVIIVIHNFSGFIDLTHR